MPSSATPLISLDAVVLDIETTSLDPRSARICEIGAVRLQSGRLLTSAPFRRLVRPDQLIPPTATQIHKIDDKLVADAPAFATVWPEFVLYVDDAVLIGHSIGFDLAVLQHECTRAKQTFPLSLALDTRSLAQIVKPDLPDYSLETLASWLGVEIAGRHSAAGDAVAAGRIFCALLPRLRDNGIRTFAEATRAAHALSHVRAQEQAAGWVELVNTAPARQTAGVDAYPYRHRVADVMTNPARWVTAGTDIRRALDVLMKERISSLYVSSDASEHRSAKPDQVGIVTERDVLRAINTYGAAVLNRPVEQIMSRPLASVSERAFAYTAIGRMNRLGIRHLGVTSAAGNVIGALSARDLLRLRAEGAVELGDEIEAAEDVPELAQAWAKLAEVAAGLVQEALSAHDIAAVISDQLCELTRRAAVLAEIRMKVSGHGGPPCAYAVLVLGSAGRGESLLAMDQDNAFVFAEDAPSNADQWFESAGKHVADILHEAGVPYCKGGIMAKNPEWRGPLSVWRQRIDAWIRRSNPEDLLAVDIFFDLRGVHGCADLVENLASYAFEVARGRADFAKLLVEASGDVAPGRTWLGGFYAHNGRIDLKRSGLLGVVSSVRAIAITHQIILRSTRARLEAIKELCLGSENDLDALSDAQEIFIELILKQQIEDIERGRPPSNSVEIKRLSRRDKGRLHIALRAVEHLDRLARDFLFKPAGDTRNLR